MTNAEIKQKIDLNNQQIELALQPNTFILNNMISKLLEENKKLQMECTHEYVDGYCIYCYKEEKN